MCSQDIEGITYALGTCRSACHGGIEPGAFEGGIRKHRQEGETACGIDENRLGPSTLAASRSASHPPQPPQMEVPGRMILFPGNLLQVFDGLQFRTDRQLACIDPSPSSQLPRMRYVTSLVLREQSACHGTLPRRRPRALVKTCQSLRETSALLGGHGSPGWQSVRCEDKLSHRCGGLNSDPWHCHSQAACVQTKNWHKTC